MPSPEAQPAILIDGYDAADLLTAVDAAVSEHLTWLADVNRALIWSVDDANAHQPAAEALAGIGAFGAWYIANQHAPLIDQPAVHDLAELDRKLRATAAILLASAPSQPDYARLIDLSSAFIARARRLEKAFAAAAAEIDALTGLQNRHALKRALEREHGQFERTNTPCAIALADLDHFKQLNDLHGHAAGDQVLRVAADCLTATSRAYDSVYRYGGEEFLLLLPATPEDAALEVLERHRQDLGATRVTLPSGETTSVTASFGVAMMRAGETTEQTIQRADEALYRAKAAGRDRVEAAA